MQQSTRSPIDSSLSMLLLGIAIWFLVAASALLAADFHQIVTHAISPDNWALRGPCAFAVTMFAASGSILGSVALVDIRAVNRANAPTLARADQRRGRN